MLCLKMDIANMFTGGVARIKTRSNLMDRKILNCISTIDELNLVEYNNLGIGVEIQDFTEPNLSDEEINNLVQNYKRIFKDFKHTKSIHGPFLDLKPSSPDLQIREVSQRKYLRALNIAAELELDYIIFHSQINPDLNEPNLAKLNNRQSREFWVDILKEVKEYKGTIVIENIFEKSPSMLKDLIETVDLPNIKVNLDVGHCRLSDVSLEEWIKELKDYIVYMHLHSNNGIYDQHLKPSKLEIENLYKLLDKYNLNPAIALEYKVDNLENEINDLLL
jgi:sugar phosphate isomerase/epimerase